MATSEIKQCASHSKFLALVANRFTVFVLAFYQSASAHELCAADHSRHPASYIDMFI